MTKAFWFDQDFRNLYFFIQHICLSCNLNYDFSVQEQKQNNFNFDSYLINKIKLYNFRSSNKKIEMIIY